MWATGLLKTKMLILEKGPHDLISRQVSCVNLNSTVSEDLCHRGHIQTHLDCWYRFAIQSFHFQPQLGIQTAS